MIKYLKYTVLLQLMFFANADAEQKVNTSAQLNFTEDEVEPVPAETVSNDAPSAESSQAAEPQPEESAQDPAAPPQETPQNAEEVPQPSPSPASSVNAAEADQPNASKPNQPATVPSAQEQQSETTSEANPAAVEESAAQAPVENPDETLQQKEKIVEQVKQEEDKSLDNLVELLETVDDNATPEQAKQIQKAADTYVAAAEKSEAAEEKLSAAEEKVNTDKIQKKVSRNDAAEPSF